jgi:hypothetical protein
MQRYLAASIDRCDPRPMSRQQTNPEYSVLVFDMASTGQPDGERMVHGFRDLATARAYSEARLHPSLEELRKPGITAVELSRPWHMYGRMASS